MSSTTDKKDSLKEYMRKIKDIKLRVPGEYLQTIKVHAKSKGMSMNQLVILLLEKDMGIDIVTVGNKTSKKRMNNYIKKNSSFISNFKGGMTYDSIKTECHNGTRKDTGR